MGATSDISTALQFERNAAKGLASIMQQIYDNTKPDRAWKGKDMSDEIHVMAATALSTYSETQEANHAPPTPTP